MKTVGKEEQMNEARYALLKKCFEHCTIHNSDHERQPQKKRLL